jgi:hypothetical protein
MQKLSYMYQNFRVWSDTRYAGWPGSIPVTKAGKHFMSQLVKG